MKHPKRAALATALAALIPLVAACGSSKPAASSATKSSSGNAASASGTSVSPKSLMDVNIACAPSITNLPIQYAMDTGLDVKNGIKLRCVQVQTGPQLAAAMISGGINIAGMIPSNLYPLLDQGANIVGFQPIYNRPYFDIIVRKDFPLPDASSGWKGVMKDLDKARIGVPAKGAAAQYIAEGLFKLAGLSDSGVTYIGTGLPNTTLAAMSNNQIDAALTLEPGITLALAKGIAVEPFSLLAGTGPSQMKWGSLFEAATRSYATSHRAVLKDFQTAYLQGVSWEQNPANKTAVIAFIQKYLGVSQAVATTLYTRDTPYNSTDTTMQASKYNYEGQLFHQLGLTKKAWTVADYGFNVNG